jgi:two-component system, sensor histidine kinase and response regulator
VESTVGRGSTFHFTVSFGLQKWPAQMIPEKPVFLQDLSVLVVDDNATNRRVLEEMLKNWRCRLATADSGLAALQMMGRKVALKHSLRRR